MEDWLHRIATDLVARVSGPMKFRLILQPLMATYFAIRAGLQDAREGRTPYFWLLLSDSGNRRFLLREAWKQVGRVFLLAVAMDAVYQYIELRWFYPGEAILVAILLALLPYFIFRGLTGRIARAVRGRSTKEGTHAGK